MSITTLSISDASRNGISGLVSRAESGEDLAFARHGRVVAEMVSVQEMEDLRRDREALRDAVLIMVRMAADSSIRTDLDQAMEAFGLNRSELEAELDAESRLS